MPNSQQNWAPRYTSLLLAIAARSQLRHSTAQDRQAADTGEKRRLATIKQDMRRHKDLLVLRNNGSDRRVAAANRVSARLCNRDLGDVLLDEVGRDNVMGVEETIDYLDAQKDLTTTVIDSTSAVAQSAGSTAQRSDDPVR